MSRILTLQRQARELGRLRTGTHDGRRPQRSDTWVVSSHSEDYVAAAADVWGGTPEKWTPQGGGADQFRVITHSAQIDAILPPGDPLSQSYEMWNRGGCVQRCDGITEQLTDSPCICRSKFGEEFHETGGRDVCSIHTRLNVILPAMPDLGYWRAETKSYWAANELAGAVDTVRGLVGPQAMIPVRLRIEQRQRVAGGKKKQFPVVVLELRGITAGQVLDGAGALPTMAAPAPVAAGSPRHELTAAPAQVPQAGSVPIPDYLGAARAAYSLDGVREVWLKAQAAGHLTDELKRLLTPIADVWKNQTVIPTPLAPSMGTITSDRDPDDVWADILRKTPEGWSMADLEDDFARFNNGTAAGSATAGELEAYLASLKVR